MKDITSVFRDALAHKSFYGEEKASLIMSALASAVPGSTLDWEEGNENWGLIFSDRGGKICICSIIPICFAENQVRQSIEKILNDYGVLCVYTDQMSIDGFKIDPDVINTIFNADLSDRFDCDNISLQDIWYATVQNR